MALNVNEIARICHEANRAYCAALGDPSQVQKPWDEAEEWQRASARTGVETVLKEPQISSKALHKRWCDAKKADGWVYGPVKDAAKKEHPCLVPYGELPIDQRRKDKLLKSIVLACVADV